MKKLKLSDCCFEELSMYINQIEKVETAVNLIDYRMISVLEDDPSYPLEHSHTTYDKARQAAIDALEEYKKELKIGIGELMLSEAYWEE